MQSAFKKPLLFVLLAVLLFPTGSVSREGLGGAAFADPSVIQEMPEGWAERPVVHDPKHGEVDLVINLNRQIYQAVLPLVQRYEKENNLKIAITRGTCGITAGVLKNKKADLGVFCCPPGGTDRLPGIRFHTLGIVSMALLVHPESSIDDVTLEEARALFQGKIRRWSGIANSSKKAGRDIPVQVIARRHCKKRPGHWKLLLGLDDDFGPRAQEVAAIPDMIHLVASNPGGIGYEVMQMAHENRDKGAVKPLKINGFDPRDQQQLVSGNYPLYRTYSFTTWEKEGIGSSHAEKLMDFLLSEIDSVDAKYGIVTASRLRKAGWKFQGDELIGEPK